MSKPALTYQRDQIWWVKLYLGVGVEAVKTKACLIFQKDAGNRAIDPIPRIEPDGILGYWRNLQVETRLTIALPIVRALTI